MLFYPPLLTVYVVVIETTEKLFKDNYVAKKRSNGLAMCSIEKDILDNIDLDTILNDFVSRNA